MTPKFVGTLMLIMIAACFITGILVYPAIPLHALAHWNAQGKPDGTLPRILVALLLPGITLLVYGLWALLPRIDPIAPGYTSFRYIYDFLMFLIIAFLSYVYAITLGAALGWQFNILHALLPAVGVFVFVLGMLTQHLKRNWFVGIRTPWTLSSDYVWNKTHKVGGKLVEIAGVLILVSIFTTPVLTIWLIAGPLLAAAFSSIIYSYILFEREKTGQP